MAHRHLAGRNMPPTEKKTRAPAKRLPAVQCALCIPSTIISHSNARNLEQITAIAYQVARAATLFSVPEIVILDVPSLEERGLIEEKEHGQVAGKDKTASKVKFNFSDEEVVSTTKEGNGDSVGKPEANETKSTQERSLLLAALLHYFVTPPYLIKSIFATTDHLHKFKYARKLPKLSSLPFMANNEVFRDFKEGLTIPKKTPKISKKNKKVSALKKLSVTKFVNIGADKPLELTEQVPVNVRVTVDCKNKKIVSPKTAYGVIGARSSFGYHVRICKSLNEIFSQSSFPEGYTSSAYIDCGDMYAVAEPSALPCFEPSSFKDAKLLMVFGKFSDLSYCLSQDESLSEVKSFEELMDYKIEVPKEARIEDGVTIALSRI